MLIIGREIGQSVIIGKNVKVTVLQYGSRPWLSIDAPPELQIRKVKVSGRWIGKFKKRTKTVGDSVIIGDTISVTILQTETGLLRFAIDAPKDVKIYREELCDNRIQPCQPKVHSYKFRI
ncbi:carbon storage regulator [Neobacillus citreus]|uniref:Carbon storage regulator n=1 Tax=Neobacillus citreus TaxID=2833578 RepID=A0A942SUE6_9BACI|nr:carbon storage regulator [Neobacillus citreus]MCH6263912.1 carbon storage regulator [Neobacillus citreus]